MVFPLLVESLKASSDLSSLQYHWFVFCLFVFLVRGVRFLDVFGWVVFVFLCF